MIEEAVRVRDAVALASFGRRGRLRDIEVLIGKGTQKVIRELRRAGIFGSFRGRVADLGDIQPWRSFVQMLYVDDLFAIEDGDGRRQIRSEKFPLVIAQDHHGFRLYLFENPSQYFHRRAAAFEALTAHFHGDFAREPGRSRCHEFVVSIRLTAKPMRLVFAIRLCSQVPLFRWG